MIRTIIFSIKETEISNPKSFTIKIEKEKDIYSSSIFIDSFGIIATNNNNAFIINGNNFEECFSKTTEYLKRFGTIINIKEFQTN